MSSKLSTDVSNSPPSSANGEDVEKATVVVAADADANIVDWDGPNNSENPQNW
jgi:hypothetical protein